MGLDSRGEYPPPSARNVSGMFYALPMLALPLLIGVAAVIAVCRANKDDLPAIVRALMRVGPHDGKRDDDTGNGPPSLPKP